MKTSNIEVSDMLSVLSVVGVEKRIGEVPGVESVTVNYAAGSATVRYDETRLNIADIKSDVRQSSYKSAPSVAVPAGGGHEGHTASGGAPATPTTAVPKTTPDAAAAPASASPAGDGHQDKPAPGAMTSIAAATEPRPSPAASPASAAPKSTPNATAHSPAVASGAEGKKDKAAPMKS